MGQDELRKSTMFDDEFDDDIGPDELVTVNVHFSAKQNEKYRSRFLDHVFELFLKKLKLQFFISAASRSCRARCIYSKKVH